MIVKGTVLGKYGTLLDPGWTEYGPISRVTVMFNINGIVTLDCSLGALAWWGDTTIANCGMVCGNDIIRYWSDVAVHTVLRQPLSKTKLRDNERKKTRTCRANGAEVWCILQCQFGRWIKTSTSVHHP